MSPFQHLPTTTFQSEPMNLAYTSATLGLHLDLPFYEYTPGVQVLPLYISMKHTFKNDGSESGAYPRFFSVSSNTRVKVKKSKIISIFS